MKTKITTFIGTVLFMVTITAFAINYNKSPLDYIKTSIVEEQKELEQSNKILRDLALVSSQKILDYDNEISVINRKRLKELEHNNAINTDITSNSAIWKSLDKRLKDLQGLVQ